jgi:hypothetical protein
MPRLGLLLCPCLVRNKRGDYPVLRGSLDSGLNPRSRQHQHVLALAGKSSMGGGLSRIVGRYILGSEGVIVEDLNRLPCSQGWMSRRKASNRG